MIQEPDIMEMEQGIILHLRHSMISGLTHLLVVLVVVVGAMVDREYVLIVLLSMRVLGRIVISVDYLSVDRQERKRDRSEYEVSHTWEDLYVHQHAYIMIHNNPLCLARDTCLLGNNPPINSCKLFIEASSNQHPPNLLSSCSDSIKPRITK
jgi:sensor histidine kinase YesM